MSIESVAWDKKNKETIKTGNILFGTRNSCIYQAYFDTTNLKEPLKLIKMVYLF
jgi:hypothetical protein